MSRPLIVGAAVTTFGKHETATLRSLAETAVADVLRDAMLEAAAVEMVFFANSTGGVLTGQEMVRGQIALRNTGLMGAPIVNVENACASSSTAVQLAAQAVASGQVDVALAVGVEKLTHPERERSFAAINSAVDLFDHPEVGESVREQLLGTAPVLGLEPFRGSFFMGSYAASARDYMAKYGAEASDFARVAVKNQAHGELNPAAHYGARMSVEQVLASKTIDDPITMLMCSPVSDGAAAVVVCSERYARAHGIVVEVDIRGMALVSGSDAEGAVPAVERAAALAYARADVDPAEVQVAEVHDATASAELEMYEALGFCGPGGAVELIRTGATTLGGRLPVNAGGGLIARGHPVGATGCAQIVEIVDQLRGRGGRRQVPGVRIGLAQNSGGHLRDDPAAVTVTILGAH